MEIAPEILNHYAHGVERDRHATWARLEFERTTELLGQFLPAAPAVVLDVGGAEGVYALPLARAGYSVQLIDPVAVHVDAARTASARQPEAPLTSAAVGDARDLSRVSDGSVDAVLMLGPLYHLVDAGDRAQALAEAHRVLRPGGRLMAAAVSRYATTLDILHGRGLLDPTFEAIVIDDLRTGVHHNPDPSRIEPEWFTLAYFHDPAELAVEVKAAGFVDTEVLAIEGPVAIEGAALSDPGARAAILRAIARVEREPALLGASSHLMAVATRG